MHHIIQKQLINKRIQIIFNCSCGSDDFTALCFLNTLTITVVVSLLWLLVRRDIPASADTRAVCGLLGTIRLVAGRLSPQGRSIMFPAVMPCSHLQLPGCVRRVPGCHHKEEEGGRFAGPCCMEGFGL